MDIWVNKTASNYQKLRNAFQLFGAPIFSELDFLGNNFDVWGVGKEPNRIEMLTDLKGVRFEEAYPFCKTFVQNSVEIKYIDLANLIRAKEAAGRFKDKNDIEQLKKKS